MWNIKAGIIYSLRKQIHSFLEPRGFCVVCMISLLVHIYQNNTQFIEDEKRKTEKKWTGIFKQISLQ